MHDELGSEARALLAAARDRLGPDAATIARMRARVTAPHATSALAKLGLVACLACAIGALVYSRRDRTPASPPPVHEVAIVEPTSGPGFAAVEQEPPVPAPSAVARVVAPALAPAEAAPVAPTRRRAGLAREIELVDLANAALHRGDALAVLETIQIYDIETAGEGQLAEDAAAIEVESRCRARDAAAGDRLATFDRKWPRSAQRGRLTAACEH